MANWRKGRPVDAATAPVETTIRSGITEFSDQEASPVIQLDTVTRTIGFVPEQGNTGDVYIGSYDDVISGSGFPVPETGIAINVNHSKIPMYGIAEASGDGVRWIYTL